MIKTRKELVGKWQPLLENEALPEIASGSRKAITAVILENQEKSLQETGDMLVDSAVPTILGEAMVQGSYTDANAGADDAKSAGIAAGTTDAGIVGIGPAVMGMVRRAIPKLMAFDTVGVQPMSGPTGQIFAMRTIYGSDPRNGAEAFAPGVAPNPHWSGSDSTGTGLQALITNLTALTDATINASQALVQGDFYKVLFSVITDETAIGITGTDSDGGAATDDGEYLIFQATVSAAFGTYATVDAALADGALFKAGEGLLTSVAEAMEAFNGTAGNPFNEMSFRIDKQTIEAKSRQLKAQYSIELAQDLKAVHGLDADTELSAILSNEILVEIDREIMNFIMIQAQVGASGKTKGTTTTGIFDLADANDVKGARWTGESYKMLLVQIEKESNEIARQTGRGAGNFIIASRNVVSALGMIDSGVSPAGHGLQSGLSTDTNSSVFAGVLGGKYKVYIDQYAENDYFVVGYKGANEMDAGVFYSPYVPLTPLRGADAKNMQPVMAFKTRYGTQVNPFVAMTNKQIMNGLRGVGANQYYRKVVVKGL